MDIVDAQVHFNKIGIEEGLAAMTALGIRSLVIDEYEDQYAGPDTETYQPYVMVGGDVARPVQPVAEAASRRYPDRLAYLIRVEYRDPDLAALVRLQRDSGAKALRSKVLTPRESEAFQKGDYRLLFQVAAENGLPLFMAVRELEKLTSYLDEFPQVTVILDHCGLAATPERFQYMLDAARYPNLYVKWAHAPRLFKSPQYPFADLNPKLRSVVDAFGAQRVMWASDITELKHSWAEDLFYIRDNPVLSDEEKTWILGKTIRTILRWPAADTQA